MRWRTYLTVLAATGITLAACGSDEDTTTPIVVDAPPVEVGGSGYPDFKSLCDPDHPGIRLYITKVTGNPYDGRGAGGGDITAIADKTCV